MLLVIVIGARGRAPIGGGQRSHLRAVSGTYYRTRSCTAAAETNRASATKHAATELASQITVGDATRRATPGQDGSVPMSCLMRRRSRPTGSHVVASESPSRDELRGSLVFPDPMLPAIPPALRRTRSTMAIAPRPSRASVRCLYQSPRPTRLLHQCSTGPAILLTPLNEDHWKGSRRTPDRGERMRQISGHLGSALGGSRPLLLLGLLY